MTKYRIPVRVVKPATAPQERNSKATPAGVALEESVAARTQPEHFDSTLGRSDQAAVPDSVANAVDDARLADTDEKVGAKVSGDMYGSSDPQDWRERALRLQAEMAAFRRRQRRIAEQEARVEQVALLKDVLVIADNLDRTLGAERSQEWRDRRLEPITQGVELTRSALQRVLKKHGLEQIPAQGKAFDPAWHEAIQVVSAARYGVSPGTVVEVLETGYRRHDALFRPAKVIVAQ